MIINIKHHGIELTPAIKMYAEEKMSTLQKYFASIRYIDVEVGMSTHHHHKGEIFECKAVVQIGGEVIRLAKEAEDLYKAIDKVRDHLRIELADLKKRLEDRSTGKGA